MVSNIEPAKFIRKTNIDEHNEMINKINEIITAINNLDIESIPQIQNDIDTLKGQIQTLNSEVSTNTSDIAGMLTTIGQINNSISAINVKIETMDSSIATNANAITEINAEIAGLLKEVIDTISLESPTHGSIRFSINHEDGTVDISNLLNMALVAKGGINIVSGSTDRTFKLVVTLTDGSTWQTNDLLIPEGGGTAVTITSVTLSAGSTAGTMKVSIGLSDGTPMNSNDFPYVDPSEVATIEGTLTQVESNVTDLQNRVTVLEQKPTFALSPATSTTLGGVKIGENVSVTSDGTISVNLSNYALKSEIPDVSQFVTQQELVSDLADYMTSADVAASYQPKGDYLTSIPIGGTAIGGVKNGGNIVIESDGSMNVSIPGGATWEIINLSDIPTDFVEGDIIAVSPYYLGLSQSPTTGWTTALTSLEFSSYIGKTSSNPIIFAVIGDSGSKCGMTRIDLQPSALRYILIQIESANNLNDTTGNKALFTLFGYAFNGVSQISSNFIAVTRENITTYINKMWRIRI